MYICNKMKQSPTKIMQRWWGQKLEAERLATYDFLLMRHKS